MDPPEPVAGSCSSRQLLDVVRDCAHLARSVLARVVNEVDCDLVDRALAIPSGEPKNLELERSPPHGRDFFAEAKPSVPSELYREVERAYRARAGRKPASIVAIT